MLWLYGYVASFVRDKPLISSALSGFVAQPCRLTTSFCANKSTYDVVEFSDKRGSKCPKKPENSPFLLGIAVHSDLRGGSMSPRLFLQQNRAKVCLSQPSAFSPISALSTVIGVLGRYPSQIATQGVLGAYTGIFTAEEKKDQALPNSIGKSAYHLATAPMNVFISLVLSAFTTPILLVDIILQTRQKWKVGMPTNPCTIGVAGRCERRRKWFTTPTLSPA